MGLNELTIRPNNNLKTVFREKSRDYQKYPLSCSIFVSKVVDKLAYPKCLKTAYWDEKPKSLKLLVFTGCLCDSLCSILRV